MPEALPTATDFDTRASDLQARYEEAWLACRIIAERLGERGLVEVYEAATRDEDLSLVLDRAGLAPGDLTATWRDELRRQAVRR